jgi:hypothetical protein
VRYLRQGEADLSRYKIGLLERYEQFQRAQLRDWILYLAGKEELTQAELKSRARKALDFSGNPALRGFGLDCKGDADERAEQGLHDLYEREWLHGEGRVSVTEAGKEHLRQVMRKTRSDRHRLRASGP